MLSSLLRPKKKVPRVQEQFSSPATHGEQSAPAKYVRERAEVRYAAADWTETDENDEETEEEGSNGGLEEEQVEQHHLGGEDDDHEDGDEETPLLPIFSAAHLDAIPVYHLTRAIRMIVLPRSETTLTWDQLRSPQVSQFLVKPMQQQIRTAHFSRATLYALMANCLQFGKEAQTNPANAGNSRTRAMICELLAMKLLKEYSTRELIDALSYDFYPLQGLQNPDAYFGSNLDPHRPKPGASRISTLEIAIRTQAKRFLAHPAVVQQLEAIWAGTIVFHSAADQLHRPQSIAAPHINRGYGATGQGNLGAKSSQSPQVNISTHSDLQSIRNPSRRTVTLYDPRDASLFKLSRLRVPRYRQFFSTCSLVILLALFLAVLSQRSTDITTLEVIFWFWSAGFMLDEIVGFNEQGFSLYILSFWNAFDLGILLFLVIFYFMRLYGIFLVDIESHEDWNSMAYDVLGASAVLLCPRVFSVLDNSRYFSQLLIAFRLMAVDLAAVFVLIIISCSGFFVAFTLSFGNNENAAGVAYRLFQMFNGYSPAAWEVWPLYNLLGKAILVVFLIVCHFLIITVLITVLTNSFLAIVSNANEEHQFVFAVNTISMVKNDALFSYVAPSNILAWILTPLRYIMPLRQFVKMNRYVIKITHWPLLFSIFAYEKIFLARRIYEPTDLVENRGRERKRTISFMDPERAGFFSPSVRMRQEPVSGFQKDRALDEVFRLRPRGDLRSTIQSQERRQTANVVNNWMDQQEGIASSPPEQDRSVVDRLERRRLASNKATLIRRDRLRRQISGTKSDGSGPADRISPNIEAYKDFKFPRSQPELPSKAVNEAGTEDDGDDELLTTDEDENVTFDKSSRDTRSKVQEQDYFRVPVKRTSPSLLDTPTKPSSKQKTPRRTHTRNLSTNTILYNPVEAENTKSSSSSSPQKLRSTKQTPAGTGTHTPNAKSFPYNNTKPRPIIPNRLQFQSVPSGAAPLNLDSQLSQQQIRRRRSSMDMAMDITSDLGLPDPNFIGAVPASFATQMAMATGLMKNTSAGNDSTDRMMGRLMLARMKTLEEGLQEVVREFKEMRTQGNSPADTGEDRRLVPNKGKRVAGKKREESRRPSSVGKEIASRETGETPEDGIIEAFQKKGSSY